MNETITNASLKHKIYQPKYMIGHDLTLLSDEDLYFAKLHFYTRSLISYHPENADAPELYRRLVDEKKRRLKLRGIKGE